MAVPILRFGSWGSEGVHAGYLYRGKHVVGCLITDYATFFIITN